MKLLFDENLSARLPGVLADVYPGSAHVHSCGLGSTDDSGIWQFAKDNGYTSVSKDSDFPPKFIWLRAANCSTQEIESLLRKALPMIRKFIQEDDESCLVLGVRSKTT